ncbi:hypothetical protein C7S16_4897 [Burkholderia thailandensis]|uniref:Uncharacterized protein n=1 Tax=Burkholderia thailandensis TaxID=57975 RepID=A0AAW9CNY5_BURTH|nr:hypothetical protein [Burkholderia thailandensis]
MHARHPEAQEIKIDPYIFCKDRLCFHSRAAAAADMRLKPKKRPGARRPG